MYIKYKFSFSSQKSLLFPLVNLNCLLKAIYQKCTYYIENFLIFCNFTELFSSETNQLFSYNKLIVSSKNDNIVAVRDTTCLWYIVDRIN